MERPLAMVKLCYDKKNDVYIIPHSLHDVDINTHDYNICSKAIIVTE